MFPTVCAHGADVDASLPFEEIQVTATRRPVSAGEVSSAITLVPAEDLRAVKLTTDALAAQPGVFLQQTTPGQGAVIVRGLKGSEVLHLVDGFRLNNAIFRNAPTQYLALVAPSGVERIEILRGSLASLYGSDAAGGVVQVVSRLPRFDGADRGSRGELGLSFDSAEQERAVRASFDVGTETLAGLVSFDYLDTGDRRVGGGERIGPSGFSSASGRAAVVYSPDDSSSWVFDVQYGRQPKTPRIDELVAGFGESEPASEEFFFAPNERRFVHLRYSQDKGWLDADWVFDVGWQRIVDDRVSRNFGSDVRRFEDNASDLYGASVTVSGEASRGSWIGGMELYYDDVSSQRVEVEQGSGIRQQVRARFPDGSEVWQGALFGQFALPIAPRQTISIGGRFSVIDVALAETPFSPSSDLSQDDVSADLGWNFELTDRVSLVANLGYGFRAPNVFDLGTLGARPGNRFNIPNTDLTSERVTQLDVGVRARGERADFGVVLWALHYDDRITSVLTGDVTADGRDVVQTQNAASADLWGFEASFRYALRENVTAELVLNGTRGEEEDAAGATQPADRVPPLNGRIGVSFAARDRLEIEPYLVFAASQGRLSDRDIRDPRIDPQGTDGWLTANVTSTWRPNDRWVISLAALNLFDERYRVHGSGLDAPGLNLRLSAGYRW